MSRCVTIGILSVIAAGLGCGARSSTDNSIGGGGIGRSSVADASLQPDATTPRDATASRDSCLTIPASEVEGKYAGSFEGAVGCGGGPAAPVSGSVQFSLSAAGAEDSFAIKGELRGQIASMGEEIKSELIGTMSCTTFMGELPELFVSGVASIYTGGMDAAFAASPPGFPNGRWRVTAEGGECQGSGSWKAVRQR